MIAWDEALTAYRRTAPAAAASAADAANLLQAHHPDHAAQAHAELRIGVNRGDRCPVELAQLLESRALIDDADLAGAPALETDVLILGGGGAGCVAALSAAATGARVLLATKLALGDGNTVMAEGGIQAAVDPSDSLQQHFEDTMRGGHFAGVPELAATLAGEGPDALRWLILRGMQFDLQPGPSVFGTLQRKRAGGTSVPRVHSYRDLTGLEMMRVLRESVALDARISVLPHHPAVELLSEGHGERRCCGAVLYDIDRSRLCVVRSGAVVLATGGSGRLHLQGYPTSNHYGATGDGLVLAYRLGARLLHIDSFQYHPTGLAWPAHLAGQLVTEAVRSAGAYLVNGVGERFVDELSARDRVAAAILRECHEQRAIVRDGAVGVLLDVPSLLDRQPDLISRELKGLAHLARRGNIDLCSEPLLVHPTLHYQNGGVAIDVEAATDVHGLFCAGEVAGGIHGRNRLMGNALLELVVFGRRAGANAARWAAKQPTRWGSVGHLRAWQRELATLADVPAACAPQLYPGFANVDVAALVHPEQEPS